MPFDQQHEPRLRAGRNRRRLFKRPAVAGDRAATGNGTAHSARDHAVARASAHAARCTLGLCAPLTEHSSGASSIAFDELGSGAPTYTR